MPENEQHSRLCRLAKAIAGDAGQEILEAALILPLVFMLLLGIYWFGRVFNIYSTIDHAAREGARVATTFACATCGNAQTSPTSVEAVVLNSLQASNLDPNKISPLVPSSLAFCSGFTQATACSTTTKNVYVCENVVLNNAAGNSTAGSSPVCGASVSFQYPFQFYFPFTSLNFQRVLLKADVQMKNED
ncbi:MAG: TadE/TadG family type IV pilus assembly protein [Acidobacteriaceae bacterium]